MSERNCFWQKELVYANMRRSKIWLKDWRVHGTILK